MKRVEVSGGPVRIMKLAMVLAATGFLTLGHAGVAKAQIINPFGVNNGNTLSKADFTQGREAAGRLLNDDKPVVGRYENWSNPVSGNRGRLTILEIYTYKGMPCRKLKSAVEYKKAGSVPSGSVLDVCKIPAGEWKIVS